MKYKTMFRLGLKLVGLALIGFALPNLTLLVTQLIWLVVSPVGGVPLGVVGSWQMVQFAVPSAVQIAAGGYLLIGGRWIVELAIPANRPYCPHCGYDLKGRENSRHCPECGVGLPTEM